MTLLQLGIDAVERGWVPDLVTRAAIRRLCRQRLVDPVDADTVRRREELRASLRSGPIAPAPEKANEQHYELPAEFFAVVLGPRRKYSCCYFPYGDVTLADAEKFALAETCRRAQLADGQNILELGCGWGSLTLWAAEHYPNARITAVSNSASQRRFILDEAAARGLKNVDVITADMNDFDPGDRRFDRVVSVEMFEHMRNYERLLARIARWLSPNGRLFVHIFCHRERCYPFEVDGESDWMGRHFFSGGIMPSADLLAEFDRDLHIVDRANWNGNHYRRTAESWLANLDDRREEALSILAATYGANDAARRFQRWRVFLLAVAELFGYAQGDEWFVSHYLFEHAE